MLSAPHYGDEPRSNFDPSWRQLRKTIPRENVIDRDLNAIIARKPDWITI
jgi:hypothetical protein